MVNRKRYRRKPSLYETVQNLIEAGEVGQPSTPWSVGRKQPNVPGLLRGLVLDDALEFPERFSSQSQLIKPENQHISSCGAEFVQGNADLTWPFPDCAETGEMGKESSQEHAWQPVSIIWLSNADLYCMGGHFPARIENILPSHESNGWSSAQYKTKREPTDNIRGSTPKIRNVNMECSWNENEGKTRRNLREADLTVHATRPACAEEPLVAESFDNSSQLQPQSFPFQASGRIGEYGLSPMGRFLTPAYECPIFQYQVEPPSALASEECRLNTTEICYEPNCCPRIPIEGPTRPWASQESVQSTPCDLDGLSRRFTLSNIREVQQDPRWGSVPVQDGSQAKSDSKAAVSLSERGRWAKGQRSSCRSRSRDAFLVKCKQSGMSYKEIKTHGQFCEAESTLRGRYRTLTKRKEYRVRKPDWKEKDVRAPPLVVRKVAKHHEIS